MTGWDRKYSIVSAVDRSVAEACGLIDNGKTRGLHAYMHAALLPLNSFFFTLYVHTDKEPFLAFSRADGNMSSRTVATPGIIYREILPSVSLAT